MEMTKIISRASGPRSVGKTPPRHMLRRYGGELRRALVLCGGLLLALLARPAAALGGSPLLPDRVPFENRVYSAYLTPAGALVAVSTWLNGSNYREDLLDGVAVTRPTLAVNEGGTLLVVFVANANGQLYMRGKPAGGAWRAWTYVGDGVIDQPQAYGGRVGVGVTVTRTDYRRWTKTTTDGLVTDASWIDNEGKLIPLGVNATTAQYESAARRDSDLSTLHPRIVRVRMYMDCCGSETPRFSYTDLNRLRDNGVRTLIINTSEAITDVGRFVRQVDQIDIGGGTVLGWARANPGVMVILEVGNEPDHVYRVSGYNAYYDPWNTRWRAMDIADRWDSTYKVTNKNVELMISLPTTGGGESYFNAFTSDTGDGRGRVGDRYRHVGVHTYSTGCLDRQHVGTESQGSVMTIIDKAKLATLGGVYITETGINSRGQTLGSRFTGIPAGEDRRWAEVGRRYVRALESFDSWDGRIKGVAFFHDDRNYEFSYLNTNPDQPIYNIDEGTQAGAHAHWAMGNRVNDSDCLIDKRVPQGGGIRK